MRNLALYTFLFVTAFCIAQKNVTKENKQINNLFSQTASSICELIELNEVEINNQYHFDIITDKKRDKILITTNHLDLKKFKVICSKGDVKFRRKKPGQIFEVAEIEDSKFTIKVKTPEGKWISKDFDLETI